MDGMDWFTADLHVFHRSVIGFCQRPFRDLDEMHGEIVRRWNAVVLPEDTVYVLGDVSFANKEKTASIVSRLNGVKVLGRGNHDWGHSVSWWRDVGFAEVRDGLFRVEEFRCSHFPEVASMEAYDNRPKLLSYGSPTNGTPLLHGHVHTAWKQLGSQINVGMDVWEYAPVSIDELRETLASYTLLQSYSSRTPYTPGLF